MPVILLVHIGSSDAWRRLGKWCEAIRFSVEQQKGRAGIMHTGYAMLMETLDNYLGELGLYEEALDASMEAVSNYLKKPKIDTLDRVYYRIAWNAYEMVSGQNAKNEIQVRWKAAFQMSEVVAGFTYDKYMMNFLEDRRDKYLF